MTETAIEYKAVTKTYINSHFGKKTYITGLENLNLKIKKGEIFGLLGLNGAGKTTAMKLALGLLFATKGNVFVDGLDVTSDGETKKMIGYQPELAYLNPTMSAYQTVNFYAKLSKAEKSKKEIFEVLNLVGLKGEENRKLFGFSKGMTQRVALAQALIHNPQILILDEPVSGLDPMAVHDFRSIIQNINAQGKTIFLSSHSISEMEKVCHRVAILVKGKLVSIIDQSQWKTDGGLEKIFVQVVR